MIARVWRGVTREADQHEFFEYLKTTGLKDYAYVPGNRGIWTLRRVHDGKAEFTLISLWDSYDSIQAFAGPDYEKAMYYPQDEKYLLELEPLVTHYEVLRTPPSWRTAALIAGAWVLHALFMAQQIYVLRNGSWGNALAYASAYSCLWALLTPLILSLAKRFPLSSRRWPLHSVLHVFGAAGFAVVTKICLDALAGMTLPHAYPLLSGDGAHQPLLSALGYGFVLYWVVLLITQAVVLLHRYNLERLKRWELQAELVNAELQTLKMQLKPHFLFNVLNSISELIHQDPKAADRAIAKLGELLRVSLNSDSSQEVMLGQELELLDRYTEIQKIRFGNALTISVNAERETLNALVPSLVLQPIVENAIRHGVANRAEGGRIEITSKLQADRLVLCVADNGGGLPGGGALKEGTGLRSTRRRLERLYGRNHKLHLNNRAEGAEARIEIPYRIKESKDERDEGDRRR